MIAQSPAHDTRVLRIALESLSASPPAIRRNAAWLLAACLFVLGKSLMRVLIVDPEPASRDRIARLLTQLDVDDIVQAPNGLLALRLAREQPADVVLLDLLMPEVDGLDVAEHLPAPRPRLIFQTALHERTLAAFAALGIDYVLEPVSTTRLAAALERARTAAVGAAPPPARSTIGRMRAALHADRIPRDRILVRDESGFALLSCADIERFVLEDRTVYAVSTQGRSATDYTLEELQARTRGAFVRTGRTELLNVACIDRIEEATSSSAMIALRDGSHLIVSRARVPAVRAALG